MLKKIISLVNGIKTANWLPIIIAGIVFVLHAFLFRGWISNDAGISFSYASNLSQGYGLVSQAGNIPVEGYPSFLWVLFLAPFFSLGLFHPIITPKLLSLLLVLFSFVLIYRTLSPLLNNRLITSCILILIAINTSFVIWTSSGLENPLYLLLLCLLLFWSVQSIAYERRARANLIILGVLASAIALTRPEGVVFFCAYPILLLTKKFYKQDRLRRPDLANLLLYTLSFALFFGGYLLFRLAYFDDLFPNLYYAEGQDLLRNFIWIITFRTSTVAKMQQLMTSVGGGLGDTILAGVIILTVYILVLIKRFKQEHLVLFIFMYLAILAYLLLPYDQKGEHRPATAFILFFYCYVVILIDLFINKLSLRHSFRMLIGISMIYLFIGGSLFLFNRSSIKFVQHPSLSFDYVSKYYGDRFNQYAAWIGIKEGSLLIPDIGGILYHSKLKVYDLTGQCDVAIAKTLRWKQNQNGFYDYIFETAKPTFIYTQGLWTYLSALDKDKRFRQDYTPIYEYLDTWVKDKYELDMYSGYYVRNEAIRGKAEVPKQIRAELE